MGDPAAFIRANTKLLPAPLVPEVRLHIAEESLPIWEKTEEELGAMNIPPPYWAFAWAGGQALARFLLDNPAHRGGPSCWTSARVRVSPPSPREGRRQRVLAADIDRSPWWPSASTPRPIRVPGNDSRRPAAGRRALDVVLIGDLFYERSLAERVWHSPSRPRPGAVVLAGDPRRGYFPLDRFHRLAEYSVPVTRELEDAEIKRTAVWRLDADRRQA